MERYNSVGELEKWVKIVLGEATERGMSKEKAKTLETKAYLVIRSGGLRGDVSYKWINQYGCTMADIPNMYP